MTPAERVAELRALYRAPWSIHYYEAIECALEAVGEELLALAEAVPARLAAGHNEGCPRWYMHHPRAVCTCGHDALAAAWAALGDNHE